MTQQDRSKNKIFDVEDRAASERLEPRAHRWPTGLIAVAFILFSWLAIYLMWRGIVGLLGF